MSENKSKKPNNKNEKTKSKKVSKDNTDKKYYVVFGGYVKGNYMNAHQVASAYKLNFNKCYLIDNDSINPNKFIIKGCINVVPPTDGKFDETKYHKDVSKIVIKKNTSDK